MFDGFLPLYEGEPEDRVDPTLCSWTWELTALLLAMTILSIAAGVLFPDVLALQVACF
jgi:hypothetical protein